MISWYLCMIFLLNDDYNSPNSIYRQIVTRGQSEIIYASVVLGYGIVVADFELSKQDY